MQTHACPPISWSQSPEWRAIARAAILKFHANRHLLTKCGAKRKSTGTACQNLPSPGRTRCHLHGGATPRGDGPVGWHTPAFPGGIPTGKPRSDTFKKQRYWKASNRIDAMTAEEKARYDAWQASHAPGSAAKRTRRRTDRAAAQWLQDLMKNAGVDRAPEKQAEAARTPTLRRALRQRIGVFE